MIRRISIFQDPGRMVNELIVRGHDKLIRCATKQPDLPDEYESIRVGNSHNYVYYPKKKYLVKHNRVSCKHDIINMKYAYKAAFY